MKVILLEKVHNLGELGDTVNVKPGFGRNYLIPYGKALPATKDNLAEVEVRRAELEKVAKEVLDAAQKRAEPFKDVAITIVAKAHDEGKLFGSVGVREIVEMLHEKNLEIEKKEVILPQGPIHSVGESEVELVFHGDVIVMLKVVVESEAAPEEDLTPAVELEADE